MTQGRLGLDPHEVVVVVDGVDRARGVGHLPHDDRGDLDRVAVGVVDLQVVGLEVPDPDAQAPPVGQRNDPPQAGAPDGADVAAEEPDDLGMPRLHDHERGRDDHTDHDRRDDPRRSGEQNGTGDAGGDGDYAGPAADGPGWALTDIDAGPRVPHGCRLGLAVWLDGLTHDPSTSNWCLIKVISIRYHFFRSCQVEGQRTVAGSPISSREPGHEELESLAPTVAVVIAWLYPRQPWTHRPTAAEPWRREHRASRSRLVAARAQRGTSARARDSDHPKVCDVQRTHRVAADIQVLAPAAVIRARLSPREIRRSHGWRGEIELDHTANLVQPAGDTPRQPEVRDPLTGNPDNLRRASTRRLRAGRIAALGTCEAAPEHDQVCPRIGSSGRDRTWLEPVLGGMLRGRNDERRLDASVMQRARRVLAQRHESCQRQPCLTVPRFGGSRRDCNPGPGARRCHRDRGQPLKRWKTVHVRQPRVGSPTTTIVGRIRHATQVRSRREPRRLAASQSGGGNLTGARRGRPRRRRRAAPLATDR